MNRRVKLCLVNRNYPPDVGSTGYFAKQLLDFLETKSTWNIQVVSIGNEPPMGGQVKIPVLYSGKTKWKRLISSFIESIRLITAAKKTESDLFIVMTDPAFLNFCAAWMLRREKWAQWSMDIYPEAFVAGKLSSPKNVFYRFMKTVLKNHPPSFFISLGREQSDFIREDYQSPIDIIPSIVGIRNPQENTHAEKVEIPSWVDPEKITLAYVGNLGEAHDEHLLKNLVNELDHHLHQVIICCRGKKSVDFKKKIRGLNHVILQDFFDDSYYKYVDVQIVSLLSEWTHICVPSKTITALQYANAVIFIGKRKSDSWKYIRNAGWLLSSKDEILPLVQNLNRQEVSLKKSFAKKRGEDLTKSHLIQMEKIHITLEKLYVQ